MRPISPSCLNGQDRTSRSSKTITRIQVTRMVNGRFYLLSGLAWWDFFYSYREQDSKDLWSVLSTSFKPSTRITSKRKPPWMKCHYSHSYLVVSGMNGITARTHTKAKPNLVNSSLFLLRSAMIEPWIQENINSQSHFQPRNNQAAISQHALGNPRAPGGAKEQIDCQPWRGILLVQEGAVGQPVTHLFEASNGTDL